MTQAVEATVVEISRLEIKPGEVLIIRTPASWDTENHNVFAENLKRVWEAMSLPGTVLVLPWVDCTTAVLASLQWA